MTLTKRRKAAVPARLAERIEPLLRRRFLEYVAAIRDQLTVRRIEAMLTAGRIGDAVETARRAASIFTRAWGEGFLRAADEAAPRARLISFDRLRPNVVAAMQQSSVLLSGRIAESEREVIRAVLTRGLVEGQTTRQVARGVRDHLGLSSYHEGVIANYRRSLETRSSDALTRVLRDQRFDGTVRRAITEARDLTPEKIDRMVSRYRDRMLTHRAETLARTEATAAVEGGRLIAWAQAVEDGTVVAEEVERVWRTRSSKVRASHSAMRGQTRGLNEPFLSGDGYSLRYPGDENAPASERANCRCRVEVRLRAPE